MMFSVHDGQIYCCDQNGPMGPATSLFCEHSELKSLGAKEGVVHRTLPEHLDMLFAAGENVVGVESKRLGDFMSSWACGRLSRQISTLLSFTDRALLLLRWEYYQMPPLSLSPEMVGPAKISWWADIARYQQLGVTVAFGPRLDRDVPAVLATLRPVLAGGRNPLAAIVRTDRRRGAGDPWSFLQNIKGIGPTTAAKLHSTFGSTLAALAATDEQWRTAGVSAAVIERLREALA